MSLTPSENEAKSIERASPAFQLQEVDSIVAGSDNGRSKIKNEVHQPYLDLPVGDGSDSLLSPNPRVSTVFSDDGFGRQSASLIAQTDHQGLSFRPPVSIPRTWRARLTSSWARNKGLFLITLAQLFGVMMNVTTKFLEMDSIHGAGMQPLQV